MCFLIMRKCNRLVGSGMLRIKISFRKKFTPKAFPMSFIGYPENHASDNYKMYNHVTHKAVITRDISKWEEFN
jgi:hypothetical protein